MSEPIYTLTPEAAREELRTGVLVLTTVYEIQRGALAIETGCAVIADAIEDAFMRKGAHPLTAINSVSWVALRGLSLAAEALGCDVPTLLARLGAEAGTLPPEQ